MDNAGTLIDIFLDLLLCKISFTSDFLGVTCAPVDLFRLLANRNPAKDTPFRTGEQILQLEVLRRALEEKAKSNRPPMPSGPPLEPLEGVIPPKPPTNPPPAPQPTNPPPHRWQFPPPTNRKKKE